MAQRGVPLREIAGYLGHSEQRTTELYAHHHPDFLMKNAARKSFERSEMTISGHNVDIATTDSVRIPILKKPNEIMESCGRIVNS